jgi:hypothetical protein
MTRQDLIEAYVGGHLPRRQFVRGLTALGVSGGAALAYAQQLRPTSAAGPQRSPAGYVVRAQADTDYGVACTFGTDAEGLSEALAGVLQVGAILDALDAFSAEDFEAGVYDQLVIFRDQLADQADALETAGATAAAPSDQSFDSADALLAAAADALNALTSVFAGVVPAIETDEQRQTATEIALSVARMAAYVSVASGDDASPSAFTQASCSF